MPESVGASEDRQQEAPGPARDRHAEPEKAIPPKTAGKAPRREFGGPPGPEPTRYGDWERNGRCTDF